MINETMRCPTLRELPAPAKHKTGWPWTEESERLPDKMPDGRPWPTISIVTPSYNQGQFIEETIRSVLLQGYPNLEYTIIDGGSTDNSVDIIKKYSPWLTYWVSEPDRGQSHAINRGLKTGTGLFATWINSDDMLCKNAMMRLATWADWRTQDVYVGICVFIDEKGKAFKEHQGRIHSFEDLVCVRQIWRSNGYIAQPAVLFPMSLFRDAGGLDDANHWTMDYELWGKFFLQGASFKYNDIEFGIFRSHKSQKTKDGLRMTCSLVQTARKLIGICEFLPKTKRKSLLADLRAYKKAYLGRRRRLEEVGIPTWLISILVTIKQEATGFLRK